MMIGNLDQYTEGISVGGWVIDEAAPSCNTLLVLLMRSGECLGTAVANLRRGDGYHGFRISVTESLSSDLLDGRIDVVARNSAGEEQRLNIYTKLLATLARPGTSEDGSTGKSAQQVLSSAPSAVDAPAPPITLGTESPDHSAVIGKDGYVFLYRGNNDVASLYAEDIESAMVQKRAAAWDALFKKRWHLLNARRIAYVQMIIPEKSTILVDKAPIALGPQTASLAALERRLLVGDDLAAGMAVTRGFYRSLVPLLREHAAIGLPPYLRTDSHLSESGALRVFVDFLSQLATLLPDRADVINRVLSLLGEIRPAAEHGEVFSGDLANRFAGPPLAEISAKLDLEPLRFWTAEIKCQILCAGKEGGHTGYHSVWLNSAAPLNLKVIAFSNSFFERGAAPRGLSWWFKTFFNEFHFLWSSELIVEEIDHYRPDVIICQTVERFLPVVPDH